MKTNYELLNKTLESLILDNEYDMTILANTSALIFDSIENLNWVGFYILKDNALHLGPFVGHPACIRIPLNKGVCGACITNKATIVVKNVHEFKGHIACDSASNSEICIPLYLNNKIVGLLDIDSPICERFDDFDKNGLEKAVKIIETELSKSKKLIF